VIELRAAASARHRVPTPWASLRLWECTRRELHATEGRMNIAALLGHCALGRAAVEHERRARRCGGRRSSGAWRRAWARRLTGGPRARAREQWWDQGFADSVKFTGDPVVARPDVIEASVSEDDEFVILASDGLWCGARPAAPAVPLPGRWPLAGACFIGDLHGSARQACPLSLPPRAMRGLSAAHAACPRSH